MERFVLRNRGGLLLPAEFAIHPSGCLLDLEWIGGFTVDALKGSWRLATGLQFQRHRSIAGRANRPMFLVGHGDALPCGAGALPNSQSPITTETGAVISRRYTH